MRDKHGNECARHVCTLGGCKAWEARFGKQAQYRIEEGRMVLVGYGVGEPCRMCREHEAECL